MSLQRISLFSPHLENILLWRLVAFISCLTGPKLAEGSTGGASISCLTGPEPKLAEGSTDGTSISCLTGPEPKLAEGSTSGASRQLVRFPIGDVIKPVLLK